MSKMTAIMQTLLDKTDNDDKLIDAIREEMHKAQERERQCRKELAAVSVWKPRAGESEKELVVQAVDGRSPKSPKMLNGSAGSPEPSGETASQR